jgi:hypothetical protein
MRLCALYKILYDELFYELRQDAVAAIERYHKKVQERELQEEPPDSS